MLIDRYNTSELFCDLIYCLHEFLPPIKLLLYLLMNKLNTFDLIFVIHFFSVDLSHISKKSFLFPVPQHVFINSELFCNLTYCLHEFTPPIYKIPMAYYKVMDNFIIACPYAYFQIFSFSG